MDLFLDTLSARNKHRAANFNQSEAAMSRVTASVLFFQGHDNCFSWEREILKIVSFVIVLGSAPMS